MSAAEELVRIRPMKAADLPRVREIEESLKDAPHWAESVWTAVVDSAAGPSSVPRRICLVGTDPRSGMIVGFAVAGLLPPQAELESIAVAAEYQRRGVARSLFAALARGLSAGGVHEIFLEVRVSNQAAQGLYRALGFAETGRRAGYYADPMEDAVVMSVQPG
jgi:ribosomal-protein-alanine N-acetyltransferase